MHFIRYHILYQTTQSGPKMTFFAFEFTLFALHLQFLFAHDVSNLLIHSAFRLPLQPNSVLCE